MIRRRRRKERRTAKATRRRAPSNTPRFPPHCTACPVGVLPTARIAVCPEYPSRHPHRQPAWSRAQGGAAPQLQGGPGGLAPAPQPGWDRLIPAPWGAGAGDGVGEGGRAPMSPSHPRFCPSLCWGATLRGSWLPVCHGRALLGLYLGLSTSSEGAGLIIQCVFTSRGDDWNGMCSADVPNRSGGEKEARVPGWSGHSHHPEPRTQNCPSRLLRGPAQLVLPRPRTASPWGPAVPPPKLTVQLLPCLQLPPGGAFGQTLALCIQDLAGERCQQRQQALHPLLHRALLSPVLPQPGCALLCPMHPPGSARCLHPHAQLHCFAAPL